MIGPSFWLDRTKSHAAVQLPPRPARRPRRAGDLPGGGLEPARRPSSAWPASCGRPIPRWPRELNIVQREIQLGRTPGEALRKMGERTDLEEVRSLASVIIQAEKFGASLVKSLRVHSETLRTKRQQHAEEMAQKAGDQDPLPHAPVHLPRHLRRDPRAGGHPDHGDLRENGSLKLFLVGGPSISWRPLTMRRRSGSPERLALVAHWRRWVAIVELFALRRPARRRVDRHEYRVLHKELLERCRSQAESANEVEASFYRYLESLAQPWLSPAVFVRADHEILLDLLVRCRQADLQLVGRSWARSIASWVIPTILMSALFLVVLVVLGALDRAGFAVLDRLRGWSDDLWFAVKRSTELQRLSFVGAVLLIVSVVVVTRTARS